MGKTDLTNCILLKLSLDTSISLHFLLKLRQKRNCPYVQGRDDSLLFSTILETEYCRRKSYTLNSTGRMFFIPSGQNSIYFLLFLPVGCVFFPSIILFFPL